MESLDTHSLRHARDSSIREVLTDAGTFPVWNSGIVEVSGEVHSAGIKTTPPAHKSGIACGLNRLPGQ